MCEELEYSELLDKAAEVDDPYERMVYIAAFAVSSYGSSYFRAGSKPFNPLLGETYESIREDKGFRFIAEQVTCSERWLQHTLSNKLITTFYWYAGSRTIWFQFTSLELISIQLILVVSFPSLRAFKVGAFHDVSL